MLWLMRRNFHDSPLAPFRIGCDIAGSLVVWGRMPIDGLTPDQRFFVGYAQWACASVRPQVERLRARTDPHSPSKYRVNGLMVNMPEFGQAFSCKPGTPMTRPAEKICKVW